MKFHQWPGYISKELMTSGKALQSYTVTIHDLRSVLAWFLLKSTAFCKENILSTSSKLLHPDTSLVQAPNHFLLCTHPRHQNHRASMMAKQLRHLIHSVSHNPRCLGFFPARNKAKATVNLTSPTYSWYYRMKVPALTVFWTFNICNEKISPSW